MPHLGAKPAVLRCSRCGRFVDWEEARLQVVCECRPHLDLPPVLVREAAEADRDAVQALFARDFRRTQVVACGKTVSLADADALIADMDGEIGGALAWHLRNGTFHIVALATDPMWQRAGVGGYLVAEAELMARRKQAQQMLVTTTNDNLPALYFYQRRGYRITAVVLDSVPADHNGCPIGFAGIPMRDEIQLTKALSVNR